jgi:hypothetical protein
LFNNYKEKHSRHLQPFSKISATGGQAITDGNHFGEQAFLIEEDLPDLFLAQDDELPHLGEIEGQLLDLVVVEIVLYHLVFGKVHQIFVALG